MQVVALAKWLRRVPSWLERVAGWCRGGVGAP